MSNLHTYRPIAALVMLILGLASLQTAQAQAVWQQNVEVRVPVERGSSISAFRDALIEEIREQPQGEDSEPIQVKRRSRPDAQMQQLGSIESELISEGWGGLSIANMLYISYEFTDGRNGYNERITSLNFVRQQDGDGPDVPVFYMETGDSQFFQNFLRREGVRGGGATGNIAHTQPFRDILLFGRLMRQQDAVATEVNGDPVNVENVASRTQQVVNEIVRISLTSR